MRIATRYGNFKQAWFKGAVPSLFVGVLSGVLTYILYRYGNAEGLQLGYIMGCPDEENTQNLQVL